MSSDAPRVFSQNWLWAFPPVYLIHLVDERFWPPGTADWATANSFLYFTNEAWLWVNAPSMLVVLLATALISARRLPEWVTVAMGLNVALHANRWHSLLRLGLSRPRHRSHSVPAPRASGPGSRHASVAEGRFHSRARVGRRQLPASLAPPGPPLPSTQAWMSRDTKPESDAELTHDDILQLRAPGYVN